MAKGKKKVMGSPDVKEVLTEGLKQHRAGTEKGRSKVLPGKTPNLESKDLKPYPNKRQIKKGEYGDIEVQVHIDDKAVKRFVSENE